MWFLVHFVPQTVKMPIKTLITVAVHPENDPQSPLMRSTSRLIHFLGVFVVGKGRYVQKSVFT